MPHTAGKDVNHINKKIEVRFKDTGDLIYPLVGAWLVSVFSTAAN
jgi:hypothetical protein